MCTNSWPLLLDLTRDECKRILRQLELEAYSAVLTAFRAQGDLSRDKKNILQDLQNVLSISTERHRAEVRRAVNDEKLTTIADNMAGPDISSEWQIEGRRLIPLMPRLVPQTAFTVAANNAANMQAEKNLTMPSPSQTGSKDAVPISSAPTTPSMTGGAAGLPKSSRPTSPASNVVVLPSGMSIHIKGGVNTDDEDVHIKNRRRSSSSEGVVVSKMPTIVSTVTNTKATSSIVGTQGSSVSGISPMKLTFTKSPAKGHTTTVTPSQKVILVSTTSHSGHTAGIIQKPLSVPVMKTATTTGGTVTTFTSPRASIIMPASMASSVANGNLGNIITVATSGGTGTTTTSAVTSLTSSTPTILATSLNAARPRTKMITARPRLLQGGSKSGLVMQMGTPVHPSPQALHNIQVKPMHNKPTIHIKHEGGMKIITQGLPTTSKILPKPPGGSSGSPVVVMSSAQPSITMVTKTASSIAGRCQVAGSRVLNITTQGGKVIASTTRGTTANVVTVNPKTLQLTAIKGAGGTTVLTTSGRVATATGAKPNVIVVQKAQPKRSQTPTMPTVTLPRTPPTSTTNSPFEKLVSFIQKQDSFKHIVTAQPKPGTSKQLIVGKPVIEGQPKRHPQPIAVKVRSDLGEAGRSSLLAELIQAVGIQPDGSSEPAASVTSSNQDGSTLQTVVVQQEDPSLSAPTSIVTIPTSQTEIVTSSKDMGGNRWVEYDMPRSHPTLSTLRDPSDTSAIKALLDLQTGAQKTTSGQQQQIQPQQTTQVQRVTNVDLGQLSQLGLQQSEIYTIDSSGNLQETSTSSAPVSTEHLQYVTTSADLRSRQNIQVVEGTTNVVLEQAGGGTVAVQLAGADLARLSSMGHEIMGELDPETGIFYTTGTSSADSTEIPTGVTMNPAPMPRVAPVKEGVDSTTSASKPIDFLSCALTQAQIDLDPYQFIEEDEPAFTTKMAPASAELAIGSQPASQPLVSVLNPTTSMATITQEPEPQVCLPESATGNELGGGAATLIPTETVTPDPPPILVSLVPVPVEKPPVLPQPMEDVKIQREKVTVETPSPEVTSTTSPSPAGGVVEELLEEMVVQDSIITIDQHEEVCATVTASNVTVAVEPGGLDTTTMVIEDFTSQQLIGDHGDQGSHGDQIPQVELGPDNHGEQDANNSDYHDNEELSQSCSTAASCSSTECHGDHCGDGDAGLSSPVRASQRKRRPPSMPDDSPPHGNMSGWVRHAAGLLQKVCKYRGSRKEKGELNASAWFLAPVDPKEVPDYYEIIKHPMDFGTVRHKLEMSQYEGWDDFHVDMMRVRSNCQQYNPPGHEVRRDCDEVFVFYLGEYERTIDKWQKQHVASPPNKKSRMDRSPVRTT